MMNFKKYTRMLGLFAVTLACAGVFMTMDARATSVLPSAPQQGGGESAAPAPATTDPLPPVIISGPSTSPTAADSLVPDAPTPGPVPNSPDAASNGIMPPVSTSPGAPAQSGLTPIPGGDSGSIPGTNVMGASGVPVHNSGTYYDSDSYAPDPDLAAAGMTGPRRLDPTVEPAQSFVVVKKGPGASSYEAQYVAATRALKLERYAAAMEMFEKLYKRNRKDPRILMGLAVAQQGAGFKESAAETYSNLLDIQPNNADAIVNLMGLMKDQYPSVTLKRLSDLRAKYPMNAGVPAQMGLVNAGQRNFDEALRYFEVAASLEPRNPAHVYNMAIVVDRQGNAAKAIKLYEQALQLDSSFSDTLGAIPRDQIYDRLAVLRRKV